MYRVTAIGRRKKPMNRLKCSIQILFFCKYLTATVMSNEDGTNGHMEQIISWTNYWHVNELRICYLFLCTTNNRFTNMTLQDTLGKINEMVNNMLAVTWAEDNSSNCSGIHASDVKKEEKSVAWLDTNVLQYLCYSPNILHTQSKIPKLV